MSRAEPVRWNVRAACRGVDIAVFFPPLGEANFDQAKTICAGCPVQHDCLEEEMEEEGSRGPRYRSGVRGGLDPEERYALYRRRKREVRRCG